MYDNEDTQKINKLYPGKSIHRDVYNEEDDDNLRQVLSAKTTDPMPAIPNRAIQITWDICNSINHLINPNRSPAKLYFKHKDFAYLVRVTNVRPSHNPGFIIAEGRDVMNRYTLLEIGSHCSFEFRFA